LGVGAVEPGANPRRVIEPCGFERPRARTPTLL